MVERAPSLTLYARPSAVAGDPIDGSHQQINFRESRSRRCSMYLTFKPGESRSPVRIQDPGNWPIPGDSCRCPHGVDSLQLLLGKGQ